MPSNPDPYHTPAAKLQADLTDNTPMKHLPQISVWYVFALNILTLGLYYPYWLYTRSNIINQLVENKIPLNLMSTVLGLFLINLVFSFMSGTQPDNLDYQAASSLSTIIYSISTLFWAFAMRNRLHQLSQASKQSGFWISAILTILFQMLYLQYKINQYIDTHPSDTSLAT